MFIKSPFNFFHYFKKKNKMKNVVILFYIITLSIHQAQSAPEGYEKGNGGIQLACTKESVLGDGVYTLDRIEGELVFKLPPASYLHSMSDENKIVQSLLDQLRLINPGRATLYEKWFKEILTQREFISDFSLYPLSDADIVYLPKSCDIKQAAIFTTSRGTDNSRFIFDQNLWKRSSALDRAYLIMHELIYREARLSENLHQTPRPSRFINAWLFAQAKPFSEDLWIDLLRKMQFQKAEYAGVPILLHRINANGVFLPAPILKYPDSGKIKKAVLNPSLEIKINDQEVFVRKCKSTRLAQFGFLDWVEFYPEGRVKKIVFSEPQTYDPDCILYNGNNSLEFNLKGELINSTYVENLVFLDFNHDEDTP